MAQERQRAAAEREEVEREAAGKLESARLELDSTLASDRQTSSQAERSLQAAQEAWQKVLSIYPMMRNAQDQVATLSEELAGEAI